MISLITIFVFVGVFLWLGNLHILNTARDWPVILILIGIMSLMSIHKAGRKRKIINDLESGNITVQEAEEKLKHIT